MAGFSPPAPGNPHAWHHNSVKCEPANRNKSADSRLSTWKAHVINRDMHLTAELMQMVEKVAQDVGGFVHCTRVP